MRKNPYKKDLKDQLPLLMQGPSAVTFLTKNEEQKVLLEKSMIPLLHEYEVKGVTFTMVQPPVLFLALTSDLKNIQNIEMGQTEVTQELFLFVMGWCYSNNRVLQNPVVNVTRFDCIAFCNKLSELLGLKPCYKMTDIENRYGDTSITSARVTWDEAANGFRLPESEEWKGFAKAGTQNRWSGTNDSSELSKYAWYKDNSGEEAHPVGEKLPNEWGLYDMTGNVEEWCWDIKHYDILDDELYALCGGSFRGDTYDCLYSSEATGDACTDQIGLRICRTIR